MKSASNSLKLGISCLMFDSPNFERILLIKREKDPYKDKWSFPGGRLEPNESIMDGMKREAYEETGYTVDILPNTLFNIAESKEYLVFSGMCFINQSLTSTKGRSIEDLKIEMDFFSLNQNDINSLWNIDDSRAIPNLKIITKRFLDAYKH